MASVDCFFEITLQIIGLFLLINAQVLNKLL